MLFQKVYILRDMSLDMTEKLEFSTESPFSITLEIRRPLDAEESNLPKDDCLCILQTKEEVTEAVRPLFEVIKNQQPAVYEIRKNVNKRLDEYVPQVVKVLRWRRGKTGHPNPIHSSGPLNWSDDGQNWNPVPTPPPGSFSVSHGIPWTPLTEEVRESVTNFMKTGANEPLAHELFQEAWSLQTDNPRSSLLIGIAAAEVGIKSLIGLLVPDAEWLAFKLPSPPIDKMLREYLPQLRTKLTFNVAPFIPKHVLNVLQDAVKYRNDVTHAGKTRDPVSSENLKEILVAVRDLLYILDVYSGHDWAAGRLSYATLESIKSEVEKQKEKAGISSPS